MQRSQRSAIRLVMLMALCNGRALELDPIRDSLISTARCDREYWRGDREGCSCLNLGPLIKKMRQVKNSEDTETGENLKVKVRGIWWMY
ncbi:hypothetical protein EVAR_61994_1 [Eumeta japonica]|uniref:Uncharacterized protein n=1 Tax=Eumeta variegata TaxID=151549 RepID=A0A4C1YJC3_EUMVA|nr:hypothetical protein EVAR_61994_1 [Eumeta japonica]